MFSFPLNGSRIRDWFFVDGTPVQQTQYTTKVMFVKRLGSIWIRE